MPRPTASRPKPPSSRSHERLREALLDAQYELHDRGGEGVLLVTTGLPLAGRTEAVSRLVQWLNPKLLSTHAQPPVAGPPPAPYWRWWQSVPATGRVSVVYDGWYEDIARPVPGAARPSRSALAAACEFEALLAASHVRMLKLHFHVSHAHQRRRLHAYLADRSLSWRVDPDDLWFVQHHHAQVRRLNALRGATDRPGARWQVIDGGDHSRAVTAAGRALLHALRRGTVARPTRAVARAAAPHRHYSLPATPTAGERAALARRALEVAQGELAMQSRRRHFRGRALAVVLEGMDAAGKSQAIRRITDALDPRQYTLVPVGVPTPEERSYPYLHRFWRTLPGPGRIALYDRSWYGRVLVERVDGLCARADWTRAYRELREFEASLAAAGVVVVKFWMSVSREEQLARFRERARNPAKRFKVDPRDWQARRHWWEYQAAARQMMAQTDTPAAPWVIVPADDKPYARHAVLEAVCDRLRAALGPP